MSRAHFLNFANDWHLLCTSEKSAITSILGSTRNVGMNHLLCCVAAEKRTEDERLNNYLTDNNNLSTYHHHIRKISPSSPSQASSFLDVQSSYGSSPTTNTYFPMSPGKRYVCFILCFSLY